MASGLQNWKIPKVSKDEVYQTSIFNFKKDYSIEKMEGTILLRKEHEPIQLLDASAIIKHRQKYEYLHIGLVQVGVKALARQVRGTSILLCLRDKRHLDFNASLLSVVESNLLDGPVHVNYFPDLMVSFRDPHILRVLTLYVKFDNIEMQDSSIPLLLMYKIRCKCMPNPNNPAAKRCNPFHETTYYQTITRIPNRIISRTVRWSLVQFPEDWKLRDEVTPETQEYESPRRIELPHQLNPSRFPPNNSGHFPQDTFVKM